MLIDLKISSGNATNSGTGQFGDKVYVQSLPPSSGGVIRNWDGETVPDSPWWNTTLITVNDVRVRAWHATTIGIVLIVLFSLIGLTCLIISWRKRRQIVATARRASEAIRRASVSARESIKRRFSKAS